MRRKPYLKKRLIWSFLLLKYFTIRIDKILVIKPILRKMKLERVGLKLSFSVSVKRGIPTTVLQAMPVRKFVNK